MSKYRRHRSCKVCGARYPFVNISSRGLCPDHTAMRQVQNITQLRDHSGPYFQRWRQSMAASVGGLLAEHRSDHS